MLCQNFQNFSCCLDLVVYFAEIFKISVVFNSHASKFRGGLVGERVLAALEQRAYDNDGNREQDDSHQTAPSTVMRCRCLVSAAHC